MELSLTTIISKSWNDWLMTLKIAFSIYFSALYAEMQIDKNGFSFFIKLSLIILLINLKLFK
jgi:hypothetical protein